MICPAITVCAPLLDQGAVDHPIGGVPLLAGEVIDRGDQVLVPLIAPISGKCLMETATPCFEMPSR